MYSQSYPNANTKTNLHTDTDMYTNFRKGLSNDCGDEYVSAQFQHQVIVNTPPAYITLRCGKGDSGIQLQQYLA